MNPLVYFIYTSFSSLLLFFIFYPLKVIYISNVGIKYPVRLLEIDKPEDIFSLNLRFIKNSPLMLYLYSSYPLIDSNSFISGKNNSWCYRY